VTPADVAEAVKTDLGATIDRRKVEITQPIKTVGTYQVHVRLHADVQATVDVEVVPAS
jgi:large subunit ribosomal protein L9